MIERLLRLRLRLLRRCVNCGRPIRRYRDDCKHVTSIVGYDDEGTLIVKGPLLHIPAGMPFHVTGDPIRCREGGVGTARRA